MAPSNKLEDINNKIFGKKNDYNLLDVYHNLMVNYGYFPFDEFKKMDAGLVNELIIRINKDCERENKAMRRGKR